jgi:urea transport system ATP-binding protein
VVVVEHDMDFVRRLDCKVTVLHEGAVLAEGSWTMSRRTSR